VRAIYSEALEDGLTDDGATALHMLAIRAVAESRYGAFPLVRLVDFHLEILLTASLIAASRSSARCRAGSAPDAY
jgi:hypothetical protein